MNTDQLSGILRAIVPGLAGYLAGKGYFFDNETWSIILGAVATIGAAVWSASAHTSAATVQAAAALPGVEKITVKSSASAGVLEVAADSTQPKVVRA